MWRFLIIVISFLFFCCGDSYEFIGGAKDYRAKYKNGVKELYDSILKKNVVVHTEPSTEGIGVMFDVPKEYCKREFKVVIKGRFKTNNAMSSGSLLMVNYNRRDLLLCYNGRGLKYFTTDVNKWCNYRDSFFLKYDNWEELKNVEVRSYRGDCKSEIISFDTMFVEVYLKND